MQNKRKQEKLAREKLGIYTTATLIVTYGLLLLYVITQKSMGLSLSDWWIAGVILFGLVELICCVVIKLNQTPETKGSIQANKMLLEILMTVLGAVTGQTFNLSNIGMASGGVPAQTETTDEVTTVDTVEDTTEDDETGD